MPIYFGDTRVDHVRVGDDRQHSVKYDATDIIGKTRYVVVSEDLIYNVVSEDGEYRLISE